MKNTIFIKTIDENEVLNKKLIDLIKVCENADMQIKLFEQRKAEAIEHLINHGYDVIGSESLNKRVAIVRKDPVKIIDYKETLKEIEDITKYQNKTIEQIEKITYNDNEIINDLKDKVVYTLKVTKPSLRISDLTKEKGE